MNLADSLYPALESALAHRDSAAQLLLAQVPFLGEPAAVALVRALVAQRPDLSLNASALSQWCAPAREAAIAHVLSKPRGRNRIESMLALEALLPREHHVEALEGILDGTAPEYDSHSGPVSYLSLHEAFVRTLDVALKERWIAFRTDKFRNAPLATEMESRNAVHHWPSDAITRCWNAVQSRTSPIGVLPSESIHIFRSLPSHLLDEALAILRERASLDERRFLFAFFPTDKLTDEEREDTVAVPWNPYTREDDRTFADHLDCVRHHFSRVSSALKSRLIERARRLPEPYDRHCALAHIVRVVDAHERARITHELAELTISEAFWPTGEDRFEFFDAPTLARIVSHPAMRKRPSVLTGFITEALHREPHEQDAIIEAALDNIVALALDDRDRRRRDAIAEATIDGVVWWVPVEDITEPLCAASPWFARRSNAEIPRWIATHAHAL